MPEVQLTGRRLAGGAAQGALLHSDTGLSFWGGIDPASGEVIDRHHPLSGEIVAGRVLALPSGRGSCTGSSVLLELILNGHAPAALVLAEPDEILTLGVLIAEVVFDRSIPVLCVGHEAFATLRGARYARIGEAGLTLADTAFVDAPPPLAPPAADASTVRLTAADRRLLEGGEGRAAQVGMQILLRMAELQGADELIDITQAHIDGCIYTGPASLRFARQLCDWGARVKVPTTLNSISVDQRRWRQLGIAPALGEPASALGDAYVEMGARPSFTCAPYLLDSAPAAGEQVVWAESNAVVYANSVLGARTLKYPDFLDICIALTGRAPFTGCHRAEARHASMVIELPPLAALDDAFYPLLGHLAGALCGSAIPVLCGLEAAALTPDDLKAFGAAFATTSATPMFHILGVTPEAPTLERALGGQAPQRRVTIDAAQLLAAWEELNSAEEPEVGLVALGNPHFSLTELARLASLCRGRSRHPEVALVVTCGREIHAQARAAGLLETLSAFGVEVLTDTCWCMLTEPVVPTTARTLMTNSGKYAHYAPGLVGRRVRFGSLAACVEAACSGRADAGLPAWLAIALQQGNR
ncbi:cis-3-hydroxy-L-proline dehydratase [Stutzerimonas azotifigens]|uniref:cis-3-hydroxy-L-proline dehydratase n=1 Tax=Stutzerimonas azotifigens TaxID=291995 RepID=UPI00040B7C81|nr:aconitase family protein [Stutzerimonas azotifigens]